MTTRLAVIAALLAALLNPAHGSAAAEPPSRSIGVRTGEHRGYGRIVFDMPAGARVETVVEGGRVMLVFSGADAVAHAAALPRNVVAASVEGLTATLSLAPDARPRVVRMGSRLVVDLLDPEPPATVPPEPRNEGASRPRPSSVRRPPPGPAVMTVRTQPSEKAVPVLPATVTAPVQGPPSRPAKTLPGALAGARPGATKAPQPGRAASPDGEPRPQPVAPLATPTALPGLTSVLPTTPAKASAPEAIHPLPPEAVAVTGAPVMPVDKADLPAPQPAPEVVKVASVLPGVISLPADPSVGAAAFRRGDSGYVVLDRRLSVAAPTGIEGVTVTAGATTMVLAVPLAPEQALRIRRSQAAWTIERMGPVDDKGPAAPVKVEGGSDGLLFKFAGPGRAVTILDPSTGGTLLVGTSLVAGSETAQAVSQRRPGYVVLPTWLGVAVEALSDREDLRAGPNGFTLRPALELSAAAPGPAGGRRFEFPADTIPALQNRLNGQVASAAAAPPRARSAPRLAAAQTMLALGLDVEAQALLKRAMDEDPQAALDAQIPALAAVAAVVAGRLDQAGALDDPRLQESPEIALWRGVRDRRLGRDTPAARALPKSLALARTYPAAIRKQIWPDLAEAAVEAGADLAPAETPPFAAALRLERAENIDEAIRAWQALVDGPDRADSARAIRRLVELQLASGRITAGAAADVLERAAVGWRGDGVELALRLRVADLRAAAGQWREALDLLRATDPLFPERSEDIRRRKTAAFQTMLSKDGAGLSPLDVILLAADYADCVPDDESGAQLAALLADKLAALDLPARAIPVLQGLVKAKPPGSARAQFGARLGAMMMEVNDAAGALTALDGSAAEHLSGSLLEERALLRARAQAALDHPDLALAALQAIETARADDLRATLLAKAGDWPGSLAALAALEAKTIPAEGPLDATMQAVIVREAEAAQRIPDMPKLQALKTWLPRLTGASADLLRVLVTAPVMATTELPRARTELALARALPKRFEGGTNP